MFCAFFSECNLICATFKGNYVFKKNFQLKIYCHARVICTLKHKFLYSSLFQISGFEHCRKKNLCIWLHLTLRFLYFHVLVIWSSLYIDSACYTQVALVLTENRLTCLSCRIIRYTDSPICTSHCTEPIVGSWCKACNIMCSFSWVVYCFCLIFFITVCNRVSTHITTRVFCYINTNGVFVYRGNRTVSWFQWN